MSSFPDTIVINASYSRYINCSEVKTINGVEARMMNQTEDNDSNVITYKIRKDDLVYTINYLTDYPHLSECVVMGDGQKRTYTIEDDKLILNITYKKPISKSINKKKYPNIACESDGD